MSIEQPKLLLIQVAGQAFGAAQGLEKTLHIENKLKNKNQRWPQ